MRRRHALSADPAAPRRRCLMHDGGISAAEGADRRGGREDLDQPFRPADGLTIGIVLETDETVAENEMRKLPFAEPDENSIGERVAGRAMDDLGPGTGIDPGRMQGGVHGLPIRLSGSVACGPAGDEPPIFIPPALAAGTMPGGKGDSLIEKEKFGVSSRRHQRPSSPLEFEPADDPQRALPVRSAEDAVCIVQAPAVAHEQSAGGMADDLAGWRDPVLPPTIGLGHGLTYNRWLTSDPTTG
jgi:hypothetical protein